MKAFIVRFLISNLIIAVVIGVILIQNGSLRLPLPYLLITVSLSHIFFQAPTGHMHILNLTFVIFMCEAFLSPVPSFSQYKQKSTETPCLDN